MLWEAAEFKNLSLPNRLVWPPMVSWQASEEGFVTDTIVERYRRRAQGGAGLLVVEATGVNESKSPYLLRIYNDSFVPGLKRLVDSVHAEGAKLSIQLIHFLRASKSGWRETAEDLTEEAIDQLIADFTSAAVRAKEAGFDAIELHAAHYYTLASFLSRLNSRKDKYGGTFSGRFRLLQEVYDSCRRAVGEEYCIGVRINGDEFVLEGSTLRQSKVAARRLAELGINYISVSAGGKSEDGPWYTGFSGSRAMPPAHMPKAVNVYLAAGIRDVAAKFSVPVITAGRIPSAELAEEILVQGQADLIGVCRPLLADPDWPVKSKQGLIREIFRCEYCNDCLERDRKLQSVDCAKREEAGL